MRMSFPDVIAVWFWKCWGQWRQDRQIKPFHGQLKERTDAVLARQGLGHNKWRELSMHSSGKQILGRERQRLLSVLSLFTGLFKNYTRSPQITGVAGSCDSAWEKFHPYKGGPCMRLPNSWLSHSSTTLGWGDRQASVWWANTTYILDYFECVVRI